MKILTFVMKAIGIIGAIWFILPLTLYGILTIGNSVGLTVSVIIAVYGFKHESINKFIKKLWQRTLGKAVICIVTAVAVVAVGFATVGTVLMAKGAMNAPTQNTTAVVLGCKANGENPSRMLLKRLKAARKFLEENPEVKCIVSGGQGADETISEAKCMYLWLVKNGISADRIIMEDKSTSTRENLLYSREIIDENGLCRDITIITNEFHQYRAGLVADSLGLKHFAVNGMSPIVLFPTYYVRELMAIAAEIVF